ncbi:MAG: hypothetical protein GY861_03360 [bacterium]|nr:hypothetical protein [bacterium]
MINSIEKIKVFLPDGSFETYLSDDPGDYSVAVRGQIVYINGDEITIEKKRPHSTGNIGNIVHEIIKKYKGLPYEIEYRTKDSS